MTRAPVVILVLAACSRGARPATVDTAVVSTVAPADSALVPADSLVLTAPDGSQVWLTEGRSARDSAGQPCFERSVEIRRDSRRIRVPLLYTGRPPERLGRTAIRAELWLDCRPIAVYRVDLATGRPTKLPR